MNVLDVVATTVCPICSAGFGEPCLIRGAALFKGNVHAARCETCLTTRERARRADAEPLAPVSDYDALMLRLVELLKMGEHDHTGVVNCLGDLVHDQASQHAGSDAKWLEAYRAQENP